MAERCGVVKFIRVEPGWYRTSCGQYETWKADDGNRSYGEPVWIVWHMGFLEKRTMVKACKSLNGARKVIEDLLFPRPEPVR